MMKNLTIGRSELAKVTKLMQKEARHGEERKSRVSVSKLTIARCYLVLLPARTGLSLMRRRCF